MQHTVNENNVLDIIKRGENETTEFKVGHVPAASICKVIASFGNSRGGVLIVGIREPDIIVGVTEKDIKTIQHAIALLVNPPQHEIYTLEVCEKTIAIVEVEANQNRLTFFQGGLFQRVGEKTIGMSSKDILEHYSNSNDSATSNQLAKLMETMNHSIIDLVSKVSSYEEKLSKSDKKNFWTGLIFCAIGIICGGVISFLISYFFSL